MYLLLLLLLLCTNSIIFNRTVQGTSLFLTIGVKLLILMVNQTDQKLMQKREVSTCCLEYCAR